MPNRRLQRTREAYGDSWMDGAGLAPTGALSFPVTFMRLDEMLTPEEVLDAWISAHARHTRHAADAGNDDEPGYGCGI